MIYFFYVRTTIWPKYMVLFHLFPLLCMSTQPFNENMWSSFIYSFFCAWPFDQKLGSSLIYFFYLYTTYQQKHMVLFHLIFLLCTTIRPELRVFIDLVFLFVHNHWTKLYGPLSFIYFFFRARPFNQKLGSSLIYFFHLHTFLSFIYSFFVHDHSAKY